MADIESRATELGLDMGLLHTINLPPGEDCGIPSDDENELLQEKLEKLIEDSSGFSNIVVVDKIPVVFPEKLEKLERVIREKFESVIREKFSDEGCSIKEKNGIWIPVNPETKQSLGYCFIEFNTPEEAQLARELLNGYKFDRAHQIVVNLFDELDMSMNIPDEWAPPETKPYSPGENLQQWLTDKTARDQFVTRAGSVTKVAWNDPRFFRPDLIYTRNSWTESYVQWSPLGTYIATIHRQGAAVWGGATGFNQLMRYNHPEVKFIDFSPGEKYLVTYSSHEPSNPGDTHRVLLKIFDVRTGKVMDFKGSADEFATGGTGDVSGLSWPVLRWSGGKNDKYFARIGENVISVYETETFSLIDKKSLEVESVMDFSWSPTDPIIALFVPELGGGNQPARVSLVQIPGKDELRQKSLFSVSDCKMYWQSNGDYLAVQVDRYTKTKKSTYTAFEIFRVKEKDIPIELLELENKNDKVIDFAWEPKGHRFAIIHGDSTRPDISFYSMGTTHDTGRVSKLATLKGKQANALYWSPFGHFIILAGLKGFNGQLEFYNVDKLETMATGEHFMATDIEWDPTGRYVATYVTSVHKMENGFNIWAFYGKLLYRIPVDDFYQFLWRPRPPSLLNAHKVEEIGKNLKQYAEKYELEDQDVSILLSEQDREKRKMLLEEWDRWNNMWRQMHEEEKMNRLSLRDGDQSDEEQEDYEAKEVDVEDILEVSEEIIVSLE